MSVVLGLGVWGLVTVDNASPHTIETPACAEVGVCTANEEPYNAKSGQVELPVLEGLTSHRLREGEVVLSKEAGDQHSDTGEED